MNKGEYLSPGDPSLFKGFETIKVAKTSCELIIYESIGCATNLQLHEHVIFTQVKMNIDPYLEYNVFVFTILLLIKKRR